MLSLLSDKINGLSAVVEQARGQYTLLQQQRQDALAAQTDLEHRADVAGKAAMLLHILGSRQREALKDLVEPLCTDALCDIYGPGSEFILEFSQTESGRYKATIRTKAGTFAGPPRDTDGGSVCEILSVVLRIAFLMIHHPRLSPVLILDEPFGNLDEDKVGTFAAFLREVCSRLSEDKVDVQIIAAVHLLADVLAPYANVIWQVNMVNGVSKVKEVAVDAE